MLTRVQKSKNLPRSLFFLVILLSVFFFSCEEKHSQADTIFTNGKIYTVDEKQPWAEAVAIQDGKIMYVGDKNGLQIWQGKKTKVIDLDGKMLLPGFHDSHVHPLWGGVELGECNLNQYDSESEIYDAIRAYAEEHPKLKWIRGGGWDLPTFPNANPKKEDLDRIVPDRPVYLTSEDGHSAWVNSKTLELAGITAKTPDPLPGRIERDPLNGEPSGTLRENAIDLLQGIMPAHTQEDLVKGLERGIKLANSYGITSMIEAGLESTKEMKVYRALDRKKKLTARVNGCLIVDPNQKLSIKDLHKLRKENKDGRRFDFCTVKLFSDGVIEAHTAALLKPYTDTGEYGTPNWEAENLRSVVAELDKAGFQVHIHAIGDAGIRNALDAFEYAIQSNGPSDQRHTIAHLELIDPNDIPRFKELNVTANFQSYWAWEDPYITELTIPVIGKERSRWLYPIRSVLNAGAQIVGGSDWSVSTMNPLDAIQIAVTRRDLESGPGKPWIPEEVVDIETMIQAYTINGARLMFQENTTGSIEIGKAADLIILDKNIFDVPKNEIHLVKVVATFIDGKEVYSSTKTISPVTPL